MYGYLVQDWITIRGSSSAQASVTQSEADWLSLQPYQDVVFWLETKSVTLGGLDTITLEYQTAPAKDESLFTAMTTAVTLAAGTTPTITKVLLAQNPTVPLARYVRWKMIPNGTASAEYGACFRIHCAANAVGALG